VRSGSATPPRPCIEIAFFAIDGVVTTLLRPPAGNGSNGHAADSGRRARTRQKLLDASRVVFERDGFHDARLADIVQEAGVATGTFYNYYPSKVEILRDLVAGVAADVLDQPGDDLLADEPVAGIVAAIRAYVEGYRRNARMMTVLVQIGSHPDGRDLGLHLSDGLEGRIERALRRWQHDGLVYADLDPVSTAGALASMVDRFLYQWTVRDLDYDEQTVIETLSRLWVRSLGLEQPSLGPRRSRRRRNGA
jgi:AcrR family transcriptional regulator